MGQKEKFKSWESRDIRDKRRSLRVGRAETLWDERRTSELGEQRHCGTKGEV